eukprot:m.192270 g.192270  ORF g.192270 m.192270 type:complete len:284 (+) comp14851_c3_seq1:202-1053(+)
MSTKATVSWLGLAMSLTSQKLDELILVNKVTAGRDKIFRLAQYLCRWLAVDKHGPAKKLEHYLNYARKLMRLFVSLDNAKAAKQGLRNIKRNALARTSLPVVVSICKFMRFFIEHFQWAGQVGLYGPPSKDIESYLGWWSMFFWLFALLFSLAQFAVEQKASPPRQTLSMLDAMRDLFDVPVPAFAIGLISPANNASVGFSGTISSAIGLYQVWTRAVADAKEKRSRIAAAQAQAAHLSSAKKELATHNVLDNGELEEDEQEHAVEGGGEGDGGTNVRTKKDQ